VIYRLKLDIIMHISTFIVSAFACSATALNVRQVNPESPRHQSDIESSADGFVLPRDIQNGFYIAHIDDHGVAHHQRVEQVKNGTALETTIEDKKDSGLSRRAAWVQTCGGQSLNKKDTDDAVRQAKSMFDERVFEDFQYLKPRSAWYIYKNGVVAYACNHEGSTAWWAPTGASYAEQVQGAVTKKCEPYRSGWSRSNGLSYGYQYVGNNRVFCNMNFN
jgi:hypothetical protein